MKYLKESVRKNRLLLLFLLCATVVNAAVTLLYGQPSEPILYILVLDAFFLSAAVISACIKEKKRARERAAVLGNGVTAMLSCLPEPDSSAEADYQEMLRQLQAALTEAEDAAARERADAADYYTVWVHQIKTPIAVMKLKLAADTEENRALLAELFRIEEYVDMVLQYIRLGSETNDLVIREYSLDELIREALRKYAPQFIEKRLKLDYVPSGGSIVTDRKWFACILDQLLSNAIKYTPAGTVSVGLEGESLVVRDTGVGIAPEDLPRIFEKGYTGSNGRTGRVSSGLGLYLAKKAADLLSLPIRAESSPGEGSAFILTMQKKELY